MKIGTKANAIDYLGKFDGSKMTIKVNGKQIYPQKRYAIVRVDNKCPDEFENIKVDYICRNISCYQGKECSKKFYGDTKEQLERKIAQVLFIRKVKLYKKVWGGDMGSIEKKDQYKRCLEVAKEIVEFLGVE